MPRPQAYGSSGSDAANASPAAMPTEVSSAEETTTGLPQPSATRRAAANPPSGATLTMTMSAELRIAVASGSPPPRRTGSSTAIGTGTRSRSSASSSRVRQGCSAYSRPYGMSAPSASTACSSDQAALASTRIRPAGPSASRTAATRSTSSRRDWPGSPTLTLAAQQPEASTRAYATAGITAGTIALTGTHGWIGAGHSPQPASSAARSQVAASAGRYSGNGPHSHQPPGPSKSIASRTSTPRKRTRIGMLTTWARCCRSSRAGIAYGVGAWADGPPGGVGGSAGVVPSTVP